MSSIQLPIIKPSRPPWNKNRLIGQKRPLLPRQVWAIRARLELAGNQRNLVLFNLAIDSKLRGCDLVRLEVADLLVAGAVRDRVSIVQSKTGRPVQFEVSENTRRSVVEWVTSPATHSLRRTKAAENNRKTSNLRAVQLLLGHTKVDSTLRYLGGELEDALSIAENIDL
jgi:integrase